MPGRARARWSPRRSTRPDQLAGDPRRGRSASASRCSSRRRRAAAGGGCAGSRAPSELPAALAAGAAEARRAFGDGAVYLEREIRPARHVEVQLLGDATRHDRRPRRARLLAPAPAPEARRGGARAGPDRRTSGATSTSWPSGSATAAGLENAATAEFLFDADRRFWFLEVNTRLQVEHGVTELVTGVDIVREQLWIAAGRPLSERVLAGRRASGRARAPRDRGPASRPRTRPATSPRRPGGSAAGRCRRARGPRRHRRSRPATGVPPDYDPLIAKLMVVDADAHAAIDRLGPGPRRDGDRRDPDDAAVPSVRRPRPGVPGGTLSIDWVDEHWDGDRGGAARRRPARPRLRWPLASGRRAPGVGGVDGAGRATAAPAAAAARARRPPAWTRAGRRRARRPVAASDGRVARSSAGGRAGRAGAARPATEPPTMPRTLSDRRPSGAVRIVAAGAGPRERPSGRCVGTDPAAGARWAGPSSRWSSTAGGSSSRSRTRTGPSSATARPGRADAAAASGPAEIRAIIPGRIAAVRVAAGDTVEAGQSLLVVEAMKMQNELRAPRAGTVERVAVGRGRDDRAGDLLVVDPMSEARPGSADRAEPTTARALAGDDPGAGRSTSAPERRERFATSSDIEIADLYTAADLAASASTRTATSACPGEPPFTRGVQADDVPEPLLDDAPVRRLRDRRGDEPALPLPPRAGPDRAVGRLRPADPDGLRLGRARGGGRGRPGRRPDLEPRRHGGPRRRACRSARSAPR